MTQTHSRPIWRSVSLPRFPRIEKNATFDVAIVGGGITGLSAALFLKESGKKVCLIERDRLAQGDTGNTTAHLTYVTDIRLDELVRSFGPQRAALVWYAGVAALDLIEHNVTQHQIDCEFRRVPGYLTAPIAGEEDQTDDLQRLAKLAVELGFEADFVAQAPVVRKPGIRFQGQAKFHPAEYMAALAKLVDGDGSAIYEQSEVSEVQDEPLTVIANGARIRCDQIVIATEVPLIGKAGMLQAPLFQARLAAFSSYVLGGHLPLDAAPEISLWDTGDPYNYLRIDRTESAMRVIFGGKDHRTGQQSDTEACYQELERLLLQVLPGTKVDHRWSGQIIHANDGIPLIGELAERQFVATGFNGNGITFGTLAGMMARDWVLGQENPWSDLFSVHRNAIRHGAWEYVKQNAAYPYYMIADRLQRTDDAAGHSLEPGTGQVLSIEGRKVACACDDEGKLHQVSAVCTHLSCLVHWNQAERTWDCPCHGSRFRPNGEVITGPAETPLEPIESAPKETAHPEHAG